MATCSSPNGFLVSFMAVLFVLIFTLWSVGASTVEDGVIDDGYHLHGPVRRDVSISHVHVVSLEESLSRSRRQSGPESPDASTSAGSGSTPDTSNSQASNPGGTSSPSDTSNVPSPSQSSDGTNNITSVPLVDLNSASSSNNDSTNTNTNDANTNNDDNSNINNNDGTSSNNNNGSGSVLEEATQGGGSNPFADADVYHDYHTYYKSEVTNRDVNQYWTELENAFHHKNLSNSHRLAAVIPLKFPFYFYGHQIKTLTIATGGFIYMSHFLHQWLTATQYVAPLMANFDTSLSDESNIFYQSLEDRFTVEWKDVLLKDQQSVGKFHFQAVLYKNNSIQFLYKNIPVLVDEISKIRHPVRVGLSDAWYNDTLISNSNIMRRTIIEYHKVSVNTTLVRNGSVIMIHALPTCNRLTSCDSCTRHENMSFNCKWCNIIGRCSDGTDWYRQHWDKQGCAAATHTDPDICSKLPAPSKPVSDPLKTPVVDTCQGDSCDGSSSFPVAGVVIIVLVLLGLIAAVGGWVYYAYTHPTSKSGMWLMEHRPSQIKAKIKFWKSSNASGAKYQAESEA